MLFKTIYLYKYNFNFRQPCNKKYTRKTLQYCVYYIKGYQIFRVRLSTTHICLYSFYKIVCHYYYYIYIYLFNNNNNIIVYTLQCTIIIVYYHCTLLCTFCLRCTLSFERHLLDFWILVLYTLLQVAAVNQKYKELHQLFF